jgi:uncharacterized protein DUF695
MRPKSAMSQVDDLLQADLWTVAEFGHPLGPAIIRFRRPVLGPSGVEDYRRLVTVVWAYAAEGTGAMPDLATSNEMERFEKHLCEAVQHDAHAVLTAVLTFDGARQWVWYTRDVTEFGQRLSVIPDYYGEPYPIELTTNEDPTWCYLREQILRRIPTDA